MTNLDRITDEILREAIAIHRQFGPGLLESFYELVLARALVRRGLRVVQQHPFTIDYDGMHFENVCRVDLLVEGIVIVELKSVERITPVHPKQLLTYLRVANSPLGLLINFGAPLLRDGITRVVNRLRSSSSHLRVNQPPSA